MNLREVMLSSRSMIPVALALPINRGPAELRVHQLRVHELRMRDEHDQRRREAKEKKATESDPSVDFFV